VNEWLAEILEGVEISDESRDACVALLKANGFDRHEVELAYTPHVRWWFAMWEAGRVYGASKGV